MHQICERFYFIVSKWIKISQKTVFWLILKGFLGTLSYALWVTPQFLCQMKNLMKIYNCGKFHLYSICGSKVINFQMFSWWWSIYEMTTFGWFLGPFSPKHGYNLLKFWPEVVYYEKKSFCKQCFKIMCLRGNDTYPKFMVLDYFWAQFTPGKPKIWPTTKIFSETTSLGLSHKTPIFGPKMGLNWPLGPTQEIQQKFSHSQ